MHIRNTPLRCRDCGEIIGSYEPLILRTYGAVRETSRASEPDLSPGNGEHYHRACYAAQLEEPGISEDA